jgi:outer membrane lipoprotein
MVIIDECAAMLTWRALIFRLLVILLLSSCAASCATSPKFEVSGVDLGLTPQQAAAKGNVVKGSSVLWGGVIIASANLKALTQFEILAYPLDSKQRPDLDQSPLGRFLAQQTGYLETTDYSEGRLITISGVLKENRSGRIGETDYTYPVLEMDKHYLWPKRNVSAEPSIHFGIGVIF